MQNRKNGYLTGLSATEFADRLERMLTEGEMERLSAGRQGHGAGVPGGQNRRKGPLLLQGGSGISLGKGSFEIGVFIKEWTEG